MMLDQITTSYIRYLIAREVNMHVSSEVRKNLAPNMHGWRARPRSPK
jgi:hypothetical protein